MTQLEREMRAKHLQYSTLSHHTDHRPDKSYVKGKVTDVPLFNYANTILLIVLLAYCSKPKCYLAHGIARWACLSLSYYYSNYHYHLYGKNLLVRYGFRPHYIYRI